MFPLSNYAQTSSLIVAIASKVTDTLDRTLIKSSSIQPWLIGNSVILLRKEELMLRKFKMVLNLFISRENIFI